MTHPPPRPQNKLLTQCVLNKQDTVLAPQDRGGEQRIFSSANDPDREAESRRHCRQRSCGRGQEMGNKFMAGGVCIGKVSHLPALLRSAPDEFRSLPRTTTGRQCSPRLTAIRCMNRAARQEDTASSYSLYSLAQSVLCMYGRLVHNFGIEGAEKIPADSAALFVGLHTYSTMDIAIAALEGQRVTGKVVYAMMHRTFINIQPWLVYLGLLPGWLAIFISLSLSLLSLHALLVEHFRHIHKRKREHKHVQKTFTHTHTHTHTPLHIHNTQYTDTNTSI